MGKVMSLGVRHVQQRFNVENRAHKVISQAKPKKAPTFEANVKELERVMREHPEIIEETNKKFSELDDRLKKVFVTSSKYVEQGRILNPDRPLPKDTAFQGYFEYGYKETDASKIPVGRISLRQAIEFISKSQQNPTEYTPEIIATEYKLDIEIVKNILENFKMFEVYLPQVDGKKKFLMNNSFERKSVEFERLLQNLKPEKSEKSETPEEKEKKKVEQN